MPSSARRAPAPVHDPALYTPAAARLLGVKPDTLYRWRLRSAKYGRLVGPPWHTDANGRPYYLTSELAAWRRQRAIEAAVKARAS